MTVYYLSYTLPGAGEEGREDQAMSGVRSTFSAAKWGSILNVQSRAQLSSGVACQWGSCRPIPFFHAHPTPPPHFEDSYGILTPS